MVGSAIETQRIRKEALQPMLEDRSMKLDVLALAMLAGTIFVAVALATYDPSDPPSTAHYPPPPHVNNACGIGGSYLAHGLFFTLGFGAYYAEASLAGITILLLLRREIDQPLLRGVGWVLSLCALCTLAALILRDASPGPLSGAGGMLGAVVRNTLHSNFASLGAAIVAISVLLAGWFLCTDYLLVRAAASSALWAAQGLGHLGELGQSAAERARTRKEQPPRRDDIDLVEEDEEEWVEEDEEAADEDEIEDEVQDSPEEIKVRVPRQERDDDQPEEPVASKKTMKKLASKLRIRKPQAEEREELIRELEAAEVEPELDTEYDLPSVELLLPADDICYEEHEREVRRKAKLLEKTFANFGFKVRVVEIQTGPVIAQYEVELEAGLRLSKITSLADDLAIGLRVPSVRVVAPIPGKNTVGIEVPNETRELVRLREVIEETGGHAKRMKIPIFLGKDVAGNPMIVDLAALPHLLIAGRTGTGKSVCLNSIILSILMEKGPDEVRMLMIDPKMVELSGYKKLPHLMHPVVTDMRKAEAILAWAVEKMEERYTLLARAGVRHVTAYNQLSEDELQGRVEPESEEEWAQIPRQLPFIVIVADEMADLMMTAGKEVEQHIIRLAQKSRAVGIHLILATQKPTVDVITGLIKSNLPARIAFQVASRTDSRVVLDEMGADKLLGNGDMLFLSPGTSMLLRGQGTYLSDDEITRVVDFVGTDDQQFVKELVQLPAAGEEDDSDLAGKLKTRDDLYEAAVDVVIREQRGSVSLLQRTLGIGYGRAARLIDFMAEDGIVGEYNGSQAREVQLSIEEWEAMQSSSDAESEADPPPKRSNRILPGPAPSNDFPAEDESPSQQSKAEFEEDADDEQWEEGEWEEDEEELAEGEEVEGEATEDDAPWDEEEDEEEWEDDEGDEADEAEEEDEEWEDDYEEEDVDDTESEEIRRPA